ncbi:hypothetical protein D9611_006624 [Ephemerocybe angulata]|uniref:Aminoglycoside phosphotransferase domain-containing protein n=1 Tax=Ephemerocybe angulata TaxID=980116 RepID=A0A8H5FGK6_9AGAR|nr:hypothetical protein D9611_006624 [Tulosesus angulatus]
MTNREIIAPGIPLSKVYHGLPYSDLTKLVKNLASLVIQLFAHRFTDIGSLYFGPDPRREAMASGTPTPKAALNHYSGFPFSPTLGPLTRTPSMQSVHTVTHEYHVGPIISWPFFGSNRGELAHPTELNRGPWASTSSYLDSCVQREIDGVLRENAGSAAPHRLHLDPDEILSSRHHKLRAVPGDESDDSDEYDLEESEEEWEGPGSAMYRDYRRNQRSTFLVAHLTQREEAVRREMGRWKFLMGRLVQTVQKEGKREEFGLDCHDLSLENVFVDAEDHTKITCVIDWESTTTRPLWASAHVPACFQSSPFVSKLFRKAIAELPSDPNFRIPSPPTQRHKTIDPTQLCNEWLYYEAAGARVRMGHRCAEWDGWEEGLVESIIGPEELEAEWFKVGNGEYDHEALKAMIASPGHGEEGEVGLEASLSSNGGGLRVNGKVNGNGNGRGAGAGRGGAAGRGKAAVMAKLATGKLPFIAEETQKERLLNQTGDICGGRGGELGRRLEAWLTDTGGNEVDGTIKKWNGEEGEGDEVVLHHVGESTGFGVVGR